MPKDVVQNLRGKRAKRNKGPEEGGTFVGRENRGRLEEKK